MARQLYSEYRIKQNELHPLEHFAHEVYRDLGCLFCFVDRGDENNGTVLCLKCCHGPMHIQKETLARHIEHWARDHCNGLDYCLFMIAGDIFLELQDQQ